MLSTSPSAACAAPSDSATVTAPTAASGSSSAAAPPFVRLSKAEKKAQRAQRAVEKKHAWRQRHKEAQHAAVAARAAAREQRLAAMDEAERESFERAERAERQRIYDEKVAQSHRIDEAFAGGLRVAFDLSYGGCMSAKEQTSLARQLSRCWGANRRASQPVALHFAGLGTCPAGCLPPMEDVERWKVHRLSADVGDAFSHDELVFLSPDADEPLTALDQRCVYVIGGLVDSSVQKHTSLRKARELGIRALRLPLAEHAPSANPRLPLTLTAVLEILLAVHAGATWPNALQSAVAPRHLRESCWENSKAARRQEARARAAASWGVQSKKPRVEGEQSGAEGEAALPFSRDTELLEDDGDDDDWDDGDNEDEGSDNDGGDDAGEGGSGAEGCGEDAPSVHAA
jgi:tRNA (guanine9-N1)-methyltransferase